MIIEKPIENFMELKFLEEYLDGHNGYVAGGCFKNIFNKEPIKDIDMFFENSMEFEKGFNIFENLSKHDNEHRIYKKIYENSNVVCYRHLKNGHNIELVRKTFGNPNQMLNTFDFTITKFALIKEKVDNEEDFNDSDIWYNEQEIEQGYHYELKVLCDDHYFEHLHMKRLVTDNKIIFPASTFERMIRYIGYGYKPCKETKMKIMMAIREASLESIITNNSLYDGLD